MGLGWGRRAEVGPVVELSDGQTLRQAEGGRRWQSGLKCPEVRRPGASGFPLQQAEEWADLVVGLGREVGLPPWGPHQTRSHACSIPHKHVCMVDVTNFIRRMKKLLLREVKCLNLKPHSQW